MRRREESTPSRRASRLPAFLGPEGLRGTPGEPVFALVSAAALAVAFWGEVVTPRDITFSPYAVLIVLLNAWVVGPRALAVVAFAGMLLQAARPFFDNAGWVTVLVNWVALVLAAVLGHGAAANSVAIRRSREQQLEVLLQAARRLNQASDMQAVLEELTRAAAESSSRGAPRATVWQVDGERLRVLAERDVRGAVLTSRSGYAVTPALRQVLERRGAVELAVNRLDAELRGVLSAHGVESIAMAPVVVDGRPFGLLSASGRDTGAFTPAQLAILTGLADLAAIAIARARELQAQRSRARVLEVLREVLLQAASARAPEDVAQRVVDEAKGMLGASTVALALRDRERHGLWVKASTRHLELVGVDLESVLGRAYAQAQPVEVGGPAASESPGDAEILGDARELLAAPVLAGPDCLGVIAAAVDGAGENAMRLLALFGSQLGSAVLASELRGELVESERAFRSLCAGLGCAAVLHDAGGRTVDANWASESITGVSVRQITSEGIFGADWSVRTESGADVPLSMRPPRYVMAFDRPLLGLVAEVRGPGGRPAWVRMDSNPILEHGRLKWIVTTFYPVPAPARKRAVRRPA